MRFLGYIATCLSLGIAGIVQITPGVEEMVKFLAWTVPSAISIVGWVMQVLVSWRKTRQLIVRDVVARVRAEVVDELWERIDTISDIRKRHEEPADTQKS